MTRKERAFLIEGSAIGMAAFSLLIAVPALINTHDSLPTFAAGILMFEAIGWLVYFFYRINREIGQ